MRLFVAVDVPSALRSAIESRVVDPLRDRVPGARWTRPEGRHLTLKFLGNVDEALVDEIGSALRSAVVGHEPFEAAFADISGFPSLSRPRVLWVGIGMGAEQLSALAASVEDALEPLGFEQEGRPFTGHLTLARFPRPRAIEGLLVPPVPSDAFDVREIVLFESKLHPKGARYTALSRLALG